MYKKECTNEEWKGFIEDFNTVGKTLEIDEEMMYYWLEVLPPVFMHKAIPYPDPKHPMRYSFGFAEGTENIHLFYTNLDKDNPRFYTICSNIINRC